MKDPLPALADELAADTVDPAVDASTREGAARILMAISRLPAPQRAVLSLAAIEGLPQAEIAEILGVPTGTVYSRIHHARERLRRELRLEPLPDRDGGRVESER